MESIAITAAMTYPALMLQEPHPKPKVAELLKEGQAIQKSLQRSTHTKDSNDDKSVPRRFSKLITEGIV